MLGRTGYPAVFAFFLISGYSIAHSINQNKTGYYWRRLKRIYPAYAFAIFFCYAVTAMGPLNLPFGEIVNSPKVPVGIGNFLMLQGIVCNTIGPDGALWSISIEWWLYMIAPLLLWGGVGVTAGLSLASFISLIALYRINGYAQALPLGLSVPLLAWSWLAGFAYYQRRSFFTFALMLLPPLILFDIFLRLDYASSVVAITAAILVFAPEMKNITPRMKAIFNWLGDFSFPLYLLHAPMLFWLAANTGIRNGNTIIILTIGLLGIGYFLSRKFLEKFVLLRIFRTRQDYRNVSVQLGRASGV